MAHDQTLGRRETLIRPYLYIFFGIIVIDLEKNHMAGKQKVLLFTMLSPKYVKDSFINCQLGKASLI